MSHSIETQVIELAFEDGFETGLFSRPNDLPGVPVHYTISQERENAWQAGWEAGRKESRKEVSNEV